MDRFFRGAGLVLSLALCITEAWAMPAHGSNFPLVNTIVTVFHVGSSVWVALACFVALVLGVMHSLAIWVMCFRPIVTYILLTIGVVGLLFTMVAARVASSMPLPPLLYLSTAEALDRDSPSFPSSAAERLLRTSGMPRMRRALAAGARCLVGSGHP